jgi:D-Tyr-tRNAtyr deacylase
MRVVLQRVSRASVTIEGQIHAQIENQRFKNRTYNRQFYYLE